MIGLGSWVSGVESRVCESSRTKGGEGREREGKGEKTNGGEGCEVDGCDWENWKESCEEGIG